MAGDGCRVVLVHGVGLDGTLFGPVAERLGEAGAEAVVVTRRGYDHRPPTAALDRHVDDLAALLDVGPRASTVVVGVSGGATLALGLALRGHRALRATVVHESLLGPAAPAQHERIVTSVRTLVDDPADGAVDGFVARLITPSTWDRLTPETRAEVRSRGATVRVEAPGFAAFGPAPGPLLRALATACAAAPVHWTVGRHSPSWRHDAAAVAATAGATVTTLDAVHTPQLEDPDGLVALVLNAGGRKGPG